MAGEVFISYRHGDTAGYTKALQGKLDARLPPKSVFLDVQDLQPGQDFIEALQLQVERCIFLLVMIGREWLAAHDDAGRRRIDDPNDFVRVEVSSALRLGKTVIPVLVDSARMPRSDELPEDLKELSRKNATHLSHKRFDADSDVLLASLCDRIQRIRQEVRAHAQAAHIHDVEVNGERGLLVDHAFAVYIAQVERLEKDGLKDTPERMLGARAVRSLLDSVYAVWRAEGCLTLFVSLTSSNREIPLFRDFLREALQLLFKEKYPDTALRPTVPHFIVKGYLSRAQLNLAIELLEAAEEGMGRAAIKTKTLDPSRESMLAANSANIEKALLNVCKSAHGGVVALPLLDGEDNLLWPILVSLLKQPDVYFPHNSWFIENPNSVKYVVNIGGKAKRLS